MTKTKRPVVRGPQRELPLPDPKRTLRLRYLESPDKKHGNPFFAVRVPRELLSAFKRWASKSKHGSANAAVRAYMSKVTGVALETDGAE